MSFPFLMLWLKPFSLFQFPVEVENIRRENVGNRKSTLELEIKEQMLSLISVTKLLSILQNYKLLRHQFPKGVNRASGQRWCAQVELHIYIPPNTHEINKNGKSHKNC